MAPRQSLAAGHGESEASASSTSARPAASAVERQAHALFVRALEALQARWPLSECQFSDIVALAVDSRMAEESRRALAQALAQHPQGLSVLHSLGRNERATPDALSIVAAAVARRHQIDLTRGKVPKEVRALPEPVRLAVALAQQALDVERMQFHGRHLSGFYDLDLTLVSRSRLFAQAIRLAAPLANSQEFTLLGGQEFQRWRSGCDEIDGVTDPDPEIRLRAVQETLARMPLHPVLQAIADSGPADQGVVIRVAHQQWALDASFMLGSVSSKGLHDLQDTLRSLERLHAPHLRGPLTKLLASNVHASGDAEEYLRFAVRFQRPHMRNLAIVLYPLFERGKGPASPSPELVAVLGSSDLKNSRLLHRALTDLILLAESSCGLSYRQRCQLLEHAVPDDDTVSLRCRGFLENLRFLALALRFDDEVDMESSAVPDLLIELANSQEKPASIEALITPVLRHAMPGAGGQSETPESQEYWEVFLSSWRQPVALIAYAQNIRTNLDEDDGSEAVLQALDRFADSAVWSEDGLAKFRALRYASTGSEHLAKIERNAQQAYAQWREPAMPGDASGSYVVEDSDHPEDLLLCGTEVLSCQAVDQLPKTNKALMGYALDGKYRMLVIRGHDGAISARRMVRLLVDESSGQPVLYVEKLYANAGIKPDGPADMALLQLARRKAEAMGCALVCGALPESSGQGAQLPMYGGVLKSLGSPAPFEYVDAAHVGENEAAGDGVVEGGKYTVINAYRLQDASPLASAFTAAGTSGTPAPAPP